MKHSYFRVIPFILVILLLPSLLIGQTEKGSIVGTVTDANGSAVSNATVTITDLGTKTTQTFTTNGEGIYNAPFLNPGTYEVSATATGFAKTVNNNVVVPVGSRVGVNLELKIGSVTETVDVVDAAPLV